MKRGWKCLPCSELVCIFVSVGVKRCEPQEQMALISGGLDRFRYVMVMTVADKHGMSTQTGVDKMMRMMRCLA